MISPATELMLMAAAAAALLVLVFGMTLVLWPAHENELQLRWFGAVLAGGATVVLVGVAVLLKRRPPH